jgi:hypothetical protein
MSAETAALPYVDEHSAVLAADREASWEALLRVADGSFSSAASPFARLDGARTRLRAETRAELPGLAGGVYRALVVRSRVHVLATRRLLAAVKRNAERR